MVGAVTSSFDVIRNILGFFMKEPLIYFVGVALVGAVAGVARKFVPMTKR